MQLVERNRKNTVSGEEKKILGQWKEWGKQRREEELWLEQRRRRDVVPGELKKSVANGEEKSNVASGKQSMRCGQWTVKGRMWLVERRRVVVSGEQKTECGLERRAESKRKIVASGEEKNQWREEQEESQKREEADDSKRMKKDRLEVLFLGAWKL